MQKVIERQTERVLRRMQRKESELQRQVQALDSNKAKQLFAVSHAKYQQIAAQLQQPGINEININSYKQYLPGLDSLQTSLRFLSQNGASVAGISTDKLGKIQASVSSCSLYRAS